MFILTWTNALPATAPYLLLHISWSIDFWRERNVGLCIMATRHPCTCRTFRKNDNISADSKFTTHRIVDSVSLGVFTVANENFLLRFAIMFFAGSKKLSDDLNSAPFPFTPLPASCFLKTVLGID